MLSSSPFAMAIEHVLYASSSFVQKCTRIFLWQPARHKGSFTVLENAVEDKRVILSHGEILQDPAEYECP